jgi:signal transduction histidine kinase
VRFGWKPAGVLLVTFAKRGTWVPTTPDATASQRLKSASPRKGLLTVLLGPQPLPLSVGITVAAAFISIETLLVHWFRHTGTANSFGALFLLGVLVVSAAGGFALAVATTLVSALIYFYFHVARDGEFVVNGRAFVVLVFFLIIALIANVLGRQARVRAAEIEERRRQSDAAASLAGTLAEQQAALRRVATLVARGVAPAEIYPAAVAELSRGWGVDNVAILQYGPTDATVVVGARDAHGRDVIPEGDRLSLEGDSVAALIQREGRPARMDSYVGATGELAERLRSLGLRSAVGAPILVDGRTWGALIIWSARTEPLPPGTELRIGDFADLVSTAIANAETRARIVTAADHARQQIERDLHDGAQQQVVSLGLQLRAVEAMVPPDQQELREQISRVVVGLGAIASELREISRGIHPGILSKGGLAPAIRGLARRSAIPVELDLGVNSRMPESVEVAAYYIVSEALTNAAKHARASEVTVRAGTEDGKLHLTVVDDGVGGAVVGSGSGLIGLKDRVEALSGRLEVVSPAGGGTTLVATIPLTPNTAAGT